jgi:hypothetical protein
VIAFKNSEEIIKKTSRDIKIMQYQLERIFQQGVSGYVRLNAGQKFDIEVEADQPVMAYIQLDPGLSPVFFSITPNLHPKAKLDLRVYMSMKQKDPSDRNHDKACLNVTLPPLTSIETEIRVQPQGLPPSGRPITAQTVTDLPRWEKTPTANAPILVPLVFLNTGSVFQP